MGDDQCPTEGDSRLRGTREPVKNKRWTFFIGTKRTKCANDPGLL